MPEIGFVLPHWLYWSALLLFPPVAAYLVRRARRRPAGPPVSTGLAYFLLLTGGFLGVHRLYLKSPWAVAFVLVFVALLEVNVEVRSARDALSAASNAVHLGEGRVRRAERDVDRALRRIERTDTERARDRLEEARADLAAASSGLVEARAELEVAQARSARRATIAQGLGAVLLLGMLIDALLLPRLVRRRNAVEPPPPEGFHCPAVERERDDSLEPFVLSRLVSRLNGLAGELVAYWSVIAVFVYYYEVVVRYVFNSPTNWAHEAMFLMFGMQYLIAGGFCLRENAHVRVDVIYTQLPRRAQAVMDIVTSTFFFIFVVTLLVTGWIFFHDAYRIGEVSFTEWGIQYWPVKLALPLGAALLLLQGLAQLARDVAVALRPQEVELETGVRPEG